MYNSFGLFFMAQAARRARMGAVAFCLVGCPAFYFMSERKNKVLNVRCNCKKCDIKNNRREGSAKACKKTEQATNFSDD